MCGDRGGELGLHRVAHLLFEEDLNYSGCDELPIPVLVYQDYGLFLDPKVQWETGADVAAGSEAVVLQARKLLLDRRQ